MTHQRRIGEITVESEQVVHWKIDNIFSFTEGCRSSPVFKALNSMWSLEILPNGETSSDSGWISLFLNLEGPTSKKGTTFSFGIKKRNREVEESGSFSWIFNKIGGYGCANFLSRTELVERKSELAPSDSLTITCTLWGHDDFGSIAKTNSLSNNLLGLLTSQKACDAILQVEQEQFPVHKLILMARSPVFAAMFETPMEESTMGVVRIEDCHPQVFRDFLVYLYSDRLEKLSRHMFELYVIADKYNVRDLKADCRIALMGNLSVENVTDAALLAEKFEDFSLGDKVKEFFNGNYDKIFRTSKWETLMKQRPELANQLLKGMAEYYAEKYVMY